MKMGKLGAALAAALTIGSLVGVAAQDGIPVNIDNFTFGPQRVMVGVGTTVTWTNQDDIPHTVVSTSQAFRSQALDTNDKFSFTFTTPGSYEYFCSLHPHMTGTIVVEAAGKGGAAP